MPSLWFVVPVHGRLPLAQICLRQLRRTCDALTAGGVDATAVLVGAEEEAGPLADELGFGVVVRDNRFLSRKYNDGIQLACDPSFNSRPADFVVPFGSDDWADWRLFLDLPDQRTMVGFPNLSFVREDGCELTATRLDYAGGCGIRVWPREVMASLGYRPADEDRVRGCDTSILINLQRAAEFRVEHRDTDPRQIVDWKTEGGNVNPYATVATRWRGQSLGDPYDALADLYQADALDEMREVYGLVAA